MIALLVSVYVLGIGGAAFVMGRLVREGDIDGDKALDLVGPMVFWPLVVAVFIVIFPFYVVYQLGKGKS